MPYSIKGKCIYKKVGCTKGSVKKYMAALHSNVKENMMMQKFYDISSILNESTISPEEKERRKRMIKRMAALGMLAGAGVTAGELMLHPSSRLALMAAAKSKEGLLKKAKGIGKQIWKPMALGMGADLVVEPINTTIAQKMEDRYKKKQSKK